MSASTSGGGGPLSPQAAAELQEGIGLTFGRWTALQMAVENEWGGRDSRAKADQLAASIFSWFANSKGPFYYEDLEDMMFDSISESFHADFEDGSVGEVAVNLLEMHEECLQSNFSSIEKLRNTRPQGNAVSQSRQVIRILLDLYALYCFHFLVQVLLLTCRVWILPTMILQVAGRLCLLTLLMTIFLLVIGHATILPLLRVYLLRLHGLLFHMPSLQVQHIRMGISSTLPLNSTQLLRMFYPIMIYLMLIWTTLRMHCQLVCLGSPPHLLFLHILSARISKCVWAFVVTVGWLEQAFDLEMSIFLFLMTLSPC